MEIMSEVDRNEAVVVGYKTGEILAKSRRTVKITFRRFETVIIIFLDFLYSQKLMSNLVWNLRKQYIHKYHVQLYRLNLLLVKLNSKRNSAYFSSLKRRDDLSKHLLLFFATEILTGDLTFFQSLWLSLLLYDAVVLHCPIIRMLRQAKRTHYEQPI